jgi:hypothetical protein
MHVPKLAFELQTHDILSVLSTTSYSNLCLTPLSPPSSTRIKSQKYAINYSFNHSSDGQAQKHDSSSHWLICVPSVVKSVIGTRLPYVHYNRSTSCLIIKPPQSHPKAPSSHWRYCYWDPDPDLQPRIFAPAGKVPGRHRVRWYPFCNEDFWTKTLYSYP